MGLDLAAKFTGCLLGGALGDAVGELAFRFPDHRRLLEELDWQRQLSYTDDTAMSLALTESLLAMGDVDPQHLGDTLAQHYDREPWRGYGPGPPTIFATVRSEGIPYRIAALRLYGGQGSYGNGAAMRAAPLGLFFHDSPVLYEKARAQAEVTHSHPLGIDGAAVQSRATALAVSLDPDRDFDPAAFLQALAGFAQTPELRTKLETVGNLVAADTPPAEAIQILGHSLAVHESLPFSLYCFLSSRRSFQDCICRAVLHGGDRDTMAAMAGALAGAYLGVTALPAPWRSKLEQRAHIEDLARRLLERRSA